MKKGRKNFIFAVLVMGVFLIPNLVTAQLKDLPRQSPAVSVTQTIGASKVTIDYSSPGVKGREIWGKLVPYGLTKFGFGSGNPAPWRAGANENTVITFSHDAKVNGQSIKAGSYGLFMIPGENEWMIVFSKNYTSWGSFFYDETEDMLRVKTVPQKAEFQEWLAYGFDKHTINSAEAFLHWEKLKVPFMIEFDTTNITLKNIQNQLRNTAGFGWQGYSQAAFYCLQNNTDLEQGITWINRSIQMNENANNSNILGYLLMAQNKKDQAIKVFRENVKKYPENWNVYDSLAEGLNNAGKTKEAIKWYKAALKKAPEQQKKRIEDTLKKLKK